MTTTHESSRQFAVDVVRRLRQAGYQALWAGGCVRDHLAGRTPKDFDVATDARPKQVRELFGFRQTIPVGQAFGVITVLGPQGAAPIEVATFRQDVGYSDGRHPDAVRFCDPREDAQRRDFTINGLFYDPIEQQVIDYVGGQQDLAAGIIRAIGQPQLRFEEDRLRMLRAVRFATDFAFELDPQTRWAIEASAEQLPSVSIERVANELRRMLSHPRRALALRLLFETGLWNAFPASISVPLRSDPRRLELAMELLGHLARASFPAAMTLLLIASSYAAEPLLNVDATLPEAIDGLLSASLGQSAVPVAEQMKLSNLERDAMVESLKGLPPILLASAASWPEAQPFLAGVHASDCIETARALGRLRPDWRAGIEFSDERLAWPYERLNPKPLIGGAELKQLGLKPGPEFARWISAVRRLQLLDELQDSNQALNWLTEQLAREKSSG